MKNTFYFVIESVKHIICNNDSETLTYMYLKNYTCQSIFMEISSIFAQRARQRT